MIKVAHGSIYFKDPLTQQRVDELMIAQCSATRSAYQAIHKHGLKDNAVVNYVKKDYSKYLNVTYIGDAVSNAKGINDDHAIFGGKRNWHRLQTGTITKEQWQQLRNNQLYASGDKNRKGNRNIQIDLENNKILINDPSKRGKWLEAELYLPKKFSNPNLTCYISRIIRKNNKYTVNISWQEPDPPKITVNDGAIGIDTNPDGLAVVEIDKDGNLVKHFYGGSQRIQYARQDKRKYDVNIIAKNVVDYALKVNKPIILEKLKFKTPKGTKTYKKSNRMKHNFMYAQLVDAVVSRANKYGIPTKLVNPGYTSIIGILKYLNMYSLNRHTAAAFVIARRGLGIKERQTFIAQKIEYKEKPKRQRKSKKSKKSKQLKKNNNSSSSKPKTKRSKPKFTVGVNLEGRYQSQLLRSVESWEWMTKYLRHPQIANLTGSQLVPSPMTIGEFMVNGLEGKGCRVGGTPTGEHCRTDQMLYPLIGKNSS